MNRTLGRYELVRQLGDTRFEADLRGPAGFRKRVELQFLSSPPTRRASRLAGLLRHPHMIEIYDIGETDGSWYCAYELVTDTVPPSLSPRAAAEVGVQVALALAHAQGAGLLHPGPTLEDLRLDHGRVKLAGVRFESGPSAGVDHVLALLRELSQPSEWIDAVPEVSGHAELAETLAALALPGEALAAHASSEVSREAEPADSLPEAGPLFGREALVLEALEELQAARGVMLEGPGGAGKSSVARHVAHRWRARTSGRAVWCSLDGITSVETLDRRLADTLGVELGREATIPRLARVLAATPTLLVLDGLERIEDPTERLRSWSEAASLCITTRRRSDLPDHTSLSVGPLDLHASVQILRSHCPSPGPGVDELARRLEGMPLALELAASRLRLMTAEQVLDRLDRLLGRLDRGQVLRASLSSSWELLSQDEQRGLAELSVFRGGFPLEGIEHVWQVEGEQVLRRLDSLARQSMVHRDGERFRVFEMVREYAAEHLQDNAAELRHGAWCAQLATPSSRTALSRPGGLAHRHRLMNEHENLREAIRRAISRGDGSVAAAICCLMSELVEIPGPYADVLELDRRALELDLTDDDRVELIRATARLAYLDGASDLAIELAEEAVALDPSPTAKAILGLVLTDTERSEEAQQLLDEAVEGGNLAALVAWSNTALRTGDPREAERRYRLAIERLEDAGDRTRAAFVQGNLGLALAQLGRPDEARRVYDQALATHRAHGRRRAEASVCMQRGNLALDQGSLEEGQLQLAQAMELFRALGEPRGEAYCAGNRALALHHLGRFDEALTELERSLALNRAVGDHRNEGIGLTKRGRMCLDQGRLDDAASDLSRGRRLSEEVQDAVWVAVADGYLGLLNLATGELDRARGLLERAREATAERHALAHAVFTVDLGRVMHELGERAAAEEAVRSAVTTLREGGWRLELAIGLCVLARVTDDPAPLDQATSLLAPVSLEPAAPARRELEDTLEWLS